MTKSIQESETENYDLLQRGHNAYTKALSAQRPDREDYPLIEAKEDFEQYWQQLPDNIKDSFRKKYMDALAAEEAQ